MDGELTSGVGPAETSAVDPPVRRRELDMDRTALAGAALAGITSRQMAQKPTDIAVEAVKVADATIRQLMDTPDPRESL